MHDTGNDIDGLLGARSDHDLFGLAPHSTRGLKIITNGFTQFQRAVRVAIAKVIPPKGPQRACTELTPQFGGARVYQGAPFQEMLTFETDCWDVHESLKSANPDFIVVDVRGPSAFAKGHVKGAINIPRNEMTATRMAEYQKDKVLVVYCAGPHCNGANKEALRLARLGLPVKMMIGGVTEGFILTPS